MEGLLGLNKSIESRESALRDLSVIERMDARIQADRQAEVQAQIQEQQFYEQIYNMSDQLLEKDRKQINRKTLQAQQQIRQHLKERGGSRKSFMQSGGMTILNDIKNGIIRSDEAIRYEENKKNLAKILEAKEKGMGHLLSPRDLRTLEDYENNEDGAAITYSGLMSEIELPPSNAFDYGTNIPMNNIINFKQNKMKILTNYKINNPDKPDPSDAQLEAFAREMGYGGVGTNENQLRQQLAAQKKAREYERTKPTKPEVEKKSFLNNFTTFTTQLKDTSVSSLIENPNGIIEEMKKGGNKAANQLMKNENKLMSRNRSLGKERTSSWNPADFLLEPIREGLDYLTQDMMGLKDSYNVALPPSTLNKLNAIVFDGHEIANGQVSEFEPSPDHFKANGTRVDKGEFDKGTYKIRGTVTGFRSTAKDGKRKGQDILLMNAYDDDGTYDEKSTRKIYQNEDGTISDAEAKMGMYTVLENEYGDLVYVPLEIERYTVMQNIMANAIMEDDDITEVVDLQNKAQADIRAIQAETAEDQLNIRSAINYLDKESFQDPLFEQEGQKYWGQGSAGQKNRYPLMKSFYMAFDHIYSQGDEEVRPDGQGKQPNPDVVRAMIDQNMFTQNAILFGIEDQLRDYSQGNSDEKIIGDWFMNMKEQYKEGTTDYNQYALLANKWLQIRSHM